MCSSWHFTSNSPIQHIASHFATWHSTQRYAIWKHTVSSILPFRRWQARAGQGKARRTHDCSHFSHFISFHFIWLIFRFGILVFRFAYALTREECALWRGNEPANRPLMGLYLKRYNFVASVNHGKIPSFFVALSGLFLYLKAPAGSNAHTQRETHRALNNRTIVM